MKAFQPLPSGLPRSAPSRNMTGRINVPGNRASQFERSENGAPNESNLEPLSSDILEQINRDRFIRLFLLLAQTLITNGGILRGHVIRTKCYLGPANSAKPTFVNRAVFPATISLGQKTGR